MLRPCVCMPGYTSYTSKRVYYISIACRKELVGAHSSIVVVFFPSFMQRKHHTNSHDMKCQTDVGLTLRVPWNTKWMRDKILKTIMLYLYIHIKLFVQKTNNRISFWWVFFLSLSFAISIHERYWHGRYDEDMKRKILKYSDTEQQRNGWTENLMVVQSWMHMYRCIERGNERARRGESRLPLAKWAIWLFAKLDYFLYKIKFSFPLCRCRSHSHNHRQFGNLSAPKKKKKRVNMTQTTYWNVITMSHR